MKKKKTIILTSIIVGVLVLALGLTYAVLSFNETGGNSQLVLGDIYMHYKETNQINIQNAIPTESYLQNGYFEFTIDGKNTYTKKDIWYEIVLNHGDEHATRTTRIRDDLLKFRLVEVNNNVETELFTNKSYNSLENQRIWVDTISKNTTSEINKIYRLYMWISNDTKVGNTSDADYDNETWNKDVYGSIKVSVMGDFEEKSLYPNFVQEVKSRYGTDTTLVAVNTNGDLYDGTGEIREYRYSGPVANNYVFFDTDGDGEKDTNEIWRIIGVFKDTVKDVDGNVVNDENGNPTYEEKVKLVRNTPLQEDEMPINYLIEGITYTIKNERYYAAWNKNNSGSELNNWTTAGLQYYLNTEADETDTSDGTIANFGYLNYLTEGAKAQISPTTYRLGNVDDNVSTVKNAYNQERGTKECASSVTSDTHNNNCNIWYGNQASWDGLVGLIYPSDYGYSASNLYWETDMYNWDGIEEDGVYASSTSWMHAMLANTSDGEFLLSPSSDYYENLLYWDYRGFVSTLYAAGHDKVRPTLYLKSDTMIIDAEGTELDPFVVVID